MNLNLKNTSKTMLSLLLLGSLATSTVNLHATSSFWAQCVEAAKDKTPWLEKGWEMLKKEGHKIKKYLPKGIREVFIGALATMIGKYIFTVLVKNPMEVAKNALNLAKKRLYVAQAQNLLKDEKFLEKMCEKALKLGLPLTTSEQIAMVALYMMDDQELTTEQLMAEETIDKIVSGEVSLDQKQLKKLVQSILKQAAENRKAVNKQAAGKSNENDEDEDEDVEDEDEQVAAKDNKKISNSNNKNSNTKQHAKSATLDKNNVKENDKANAVIAADSKNTNKENITTKTTPVETDNKNNAENNAGENVANKTESDGKALPTPGNAIALPTVAPAN